MPIPTPKPVESSLFPTLTHEQIDATRTSSWHETFREVTTPCTLVDLGALGEDEEFIRWLDADSIFLPEGSQFPDLPQNGEPGPSTRESRSRSSSTSSSATESSDSSSVPPVYRLPRLNDAIRNAIKKHGGAVFPKLNWTAPKDAAFILPQTANGPLHCTSPADVYLLIKSSDFISHSVDPERAYAFGDDTSFPAEELLDATASSESNLKQSPKLELVLKQHVQIVPSRELRCFVRSNILLGICQRDNNFYDHLQKPEAQESIRDNVKAFWEDEIRDHHQALGRNYVFDLHLDSSLEDAQIIDINPYRGSTDPLLFTYPELLFILEQAQQPIYSDSTAERPRLPILKVIDSASHPEATRPAPTFGGNMMPLEMIEMSQGRSMEEFREVWEEAVTRGMA